MSNEGQAERDSLCLLENASLTESDCVMYGCFSSIKK